MKRLIVLTVSWWILILAYVGAPCRLVGEIEYPGRFLGHFVFSLIGV